MRRSSSKQNNPLCVAELAALAVFCGALLFILYLSTPVTNQFDGMGHDGRFYFSIAAKFHGQLYDTKEPLQYGATQAAWESMPPWCWRLLTPALAGALPFPLKTNFLIVNSIAAYLTLLALYVLIAQLGYSRSIRVTALLLYAGAFWSVRSVFHYPLMIDPVTNFFIVLILLAALYERYRTVPLLLFLGALQKESIILLAPVVFALRVQRTGLTRTNQLYFAMLLGASVLPLGIVRLMIDASLPYAPEAVLRKTFLLQAFSAEFWPKFLVATFTSLGVIPLCVITFPHEFLNTIKRNPFLAIYLALAAVALFGGTSKARLLISLLLPLTIVVADILDQCQTRRDSTYSYWMASIILFHVFFGRVFAALTVDSSAREWLAPVYTHLSLEAVLFQIIVGSACWIMLARSLCVSSPVDTLNDNLYSRGTRSGQANDINAETRTIPMQISVESAQRARMKGRKTRL